MNIRKRRQTRTVRVGTLNIGGGNPIAIQTMWKVPLKNVDTSVLQRISGLEKMGCQLLRFAVPDEDQAEIFARLSEQTNMPLVADIHFRHDLALMVMDSRVAKVRINPGNIGARWKVREVVRKAMDRSIPLRIGVNAGSLPPRLRKEGEVASAMVKAAEAESEILESLAFTDYIVSLKASDSDTTIEANKQFSKGNSVPLHLGVTEAGPLVPGLVKSSIALHHLLSEGIGDTIRVSLSDTMEQEIYAAREILRESGQEGSGITLISCPRCARATFDVHQFVEAIQNELRMIDSNSTVAVMGCIVNGPEEAKHADLGITGSGEQVLIFRHGRVIRKVDPQEAVHAFREELAKLERL